MNPAAPSPAAAEPPAARRPAGGGPPLAPPPPPGGAGRPRRGGGVPDAGRRCSPSYASPLASRLGGLALRAWPAAFAGRACSGPGEKPLLACPRTGTCRDEAQVTDRRAATS